jgi:hypothetical protein
MTLELTFEAWPSCRSEVKHVTQLQSLHTEPAKRLSTMHNGGSSWKNVIVVKRSGQGRFLVLPTSLIASMKIFNHARYLSIMCIISSGKANKHRFNHGPHCGGALELNLYSQAGTQARCFHSATSSASGLSPETMAAYTRIWRVWYLLLFSCDCLHW